MSAADLPDYDYDVDEHQGHEEEKNGTGAAGKTKYASFHRIHQPSLYGSLPPLWGRYLLMKASPSNVKTIY